MTPDTLTLRKQLRRSRSTNAILGLVLVIVLLFLTLKGF